MATDPALALNAIEAANQARADIWTAFHRAQYQLTRNSPPNLSVVRTALAEAVEACDRTLAAIIRAQAEVEIFAVESLLPTREANDG